MRIEGMIEDEGEKREEIIDWNDEDKREKENDEKWYSYGEEERKWNNEGGNFRKDYKCNKI